MPAAPPPGPGAEKLRDRAAEWIEPDRLTSLLVDCTGGHEVWGDPTLAGIDAGILTVVQTAPMQARCAALLREFGERRLARVRIECLVVPIEALEARAPGWRGAAPFLPQAIFEEFLADPRARLLTAVACDTQTVGMGSGERRRLVSDYEVNQTGVSPVVNPRVELLAGGDRVEVKTRLAAGRHAVRLDLALRTRALDAESERVAEGYGTFELPRVEESAFWSSAIVPSGKVFLSCGLGGGPEKGSAALLVRARPLGRPVPSRHPGEFPAAEGTFVGFYDVPLRVFPPFEEPLFQEGLMAGRPAAGDRKAVHDFVYLLDSYAERFAPEGALDGGPWHDGLPGGVAFVAMGEEASRPVLEAFLRTRQALPRLAFVDLRLLAVPREAFAAFAGKLEDGIVLKAGWDAGLEPEATSLRCFVTGLAGQLISARRAKSEAIVSGAEIVSGGTGYALTEVMDLVTETVASGYALEVRASEIPGSERVELESCGLIAQTDTTPRHKIMMPRADVTGAVSSETVKTTDRGRVEAQITVPRQTVHRWRAHVVVPRERDAVLDVSAGEGGEVRVLVGSVRIVEP